MTRLLVLVEGSSEEIFVEKMLAPHLHKFGVYVKATGVISKRLANGQKFTGGNLWSNVRLSLQPLLADSNACVTTLLDFYGLPEDFPGVPLQTGLENAPPLMMKPAMPVPCRARSRQSRFPHPNPLPQVGEGTNERFASFTLPAIPGTARNRVEYVQSTFSEAMGNPPRFIPFLALHEFEAWYFARPEQVAEFYGKPSVAQLMKQACHEFDGPENINHGKETHPSKRLESYGMGFRKTSGVAVLKDIGLEAIRTSCPHFNAWLTHLEKLAVSA